MNTERHELGDDDLEGLRAAAHDPQALAATVNGLVELINTLTSERDDLLARRNDRKSAYRNARRDKRAADLRCAELARERDTARQRVAQLETALEATLRFAPTSWVGGHHGTQICGVCRRTIGDADGAHTPNPHDPLCPWGTVTDALNPTAGPTTGPEPTRTAPMGSERRTAPDPQVTHLHSVYERLAACIEASVTSAAADRRTVTRPKDAAQYATNALLYHEPRLLAEAAVTISRDAVEALLADTPDT